MLWRRVLVLFMLLTLLPGCRSSGAEAYTYPAKVGGKYDDSRYYSKTEYYDLVNNSYIADWFVHYDQISFLGDFVQYRLYLYRWEPKSSSYITEADYPKTADAKNTHEYQSYYLRPEGGSKFRIGFSHEFVTNADPHEKIDQVANLDSRSLSMPDVDNFMQVYFAQVLTTGDPSASVIYSYYDCYQRYTYFKYKDIYYSYDGINLKSVFWYTNNGSISVDFLYEDGKDIEKQELDFGPVGDLTDPEKAEEMAAKITRAVMEPYYWKHYVPIGVCITVIVTTLVTSIVIAVIKKRRHMKHIRQLASGTTSAEAAE